MAETTSLQVVPIAANSESASTSVLPIRRAFVGGLWVVGAICLLALLAPWISPHSPYAQDLANRTVPPAWFAEGSWEHILGTDGLGRDYLSRLLFGARISLLVGIVTTLVSGLIGTVLGMTAGYFGGWTDKLISFLITARLSMPIVLAALAVVSLFGGSLTIVVAVLALLLWDRFAVVTRSATAQLREREFVLAARAVGCSTLRILVTELLPNIKRQLVVIATLEMANAILLESALSFLGLGVQPPMPSWGLMIAEAKDSMLFDPWLIFIPGIALFVLVLAINVMGDAWQRGERRDAS